LNAVQNTRTDDTIVLGASLARNEARLWVHDTGCGVPVSDWARIFERFERGTGASRRYRGSGLGLAVVKAIVEAHGGHVELESRVGDGSKFTLVVPKEAASGEPNA
jgi:signal transduction histidine kinase